MCEKYRQCFRFLQGFHEIALSAKGRGAPGPSQELLSAIMVQGGGRVGDPRIKTGQSQARAQLSPMEVNLTCFRLCPGNIYTELRSPFRLGGDLSAPEAVRVELLLYLEGEVSRNACLRSSKGRVTEPSPVSGRLTRGVLWIAVGLQGWDPLAHCCSTRA